jgi:transcriptional regulator with XRE-family HTH domain
MTLRERLRQLREDRRYTLRELSDRIAQATGARMSFSYLSSLERVDTTPSIETLSNIASGYGISVQALLAPVDMNDNRTDDHYPLGLLEFATEENLDITSDWIDTLASIRFRGEPPQTAKEWRAIYVVLDMMPSRKQDERT